MEIDESESPFILQLSLEKLIRELYSEPNQCPRTIKTLRLLAKSKNRLELINGIANLETLEDDAELIAELARNLFPPALGSNEIKALCIPYQNIHFNFSERLKTIVEGAGDEFSFRIRELSAHKFYVMSCCLIISKVAGIRLDVGRPIFYDIPNSDGVMRHYRILYNADFLEIFPNNEFKLPDIDEINHLMDNYNDLELWKKFFPPKSWVMKGFAIMTLVDATVENAVSNFKGQLLDLSSPDFINHITGIFRSIFNFSDINVGFTLYDKAKNRFGSALERYGGKSLLLGDTHISATEMFCPEGHRILFQEKTYFSASNTEHFKVKFPELPFSKNLEAIHAGSFILMPIFRGEELLGILELVSQRTGLLNSINANQLELVRPYLSDKFSQLSNDIENEIQASMHSEYTALHSSVNWKFRERVIERLNGVMVNQESEELKIVFEDVFALYGQVDIRGSAAARDYCTQLDLEAQLIQAIKILQLSKSPKKTLLNDVTKRIQCLLDTIKASYQSGAEQQVDDFLEAYFYPCFEAFDDCLETLAAFKQFRNDVNNQDGIFRTYRSGYQTSISMINQALVSAIDQAQRGAQKWFPHYFERLRTDGVEHTIYLGESISPGSGFSAQRLKRLRQWQMEAICKMEVAHRSIAESLPLRLQVTSLILAFGNPIDINFRMDEKHFDVAGTFDARFEVIKKRIDKAVISGSSERITLPGYLTIVYFNENQRTEYLSHIHVLAKKQMLSTSVEEFSVEDMQGVTGLKGMRTALL